MRHRPFAQDQSPSTPVCKEKMVSYGAKYTDIEHRARQDEPWEFPVQVVRELKLLSDEVKFRFLSRLLGVCFLEDIVVELARERLDVLRMYACISQEVKPQTSSLP